MKGHFTASSGKHFTSGYRWRTLESQTHAPVKLQYICVCTDKIIYVVSDGELGHMVQRQDSVCFLAKLYEAVHKKKCVERERAAVKATK